MKPHADYRLEFVYLMNDYFDVQFSNSDVKKYIDYESEIDKFKDKN